MWPSSRRSFEIQEIGRFALPDPRAKLVAAGRQQMIEDAALPIGCRLAFLGATILDNGLFLDAVVAPAEGAAFVDRVQRVDQRHAARQIEPGRLAPLAETVQQVGFRRTRQGRVG